MASEVWVLDTSVAAAWFFVDDPQWTAALAVRGRLVEDPGHFVVPHLFYSELAHILARKSKGDSAFVRAGTALVLRLGIRTLALSEKALARACDWSCSGLGGYDGTFVALAEDLGGRWITLDARAVRRAGERVSVLAT